MKGSRKFSLMTALLSVINENETDDSNYILANYLLQHFDELSDLNIYDVSEECFVSRSSVRRFCNSIGFDNFSDVKRFAFEWKYQHQKYLNTAIVLDQKQYLKGSIDAVIDSIDTIVNSEMLAELAKMIFESREVVLIVSEFSGMCVKEFQQSMVTNHKIIRIMSSYYIDDDVLKGLGDRDLVIAISVTGNYAASLEELIDEITCKKILITANRDVDYSNAYTKVININNHKNLLYAREYLKYGIDYLFDLIFAEYSKKYGSRRFEEEKDV